MRAEPAAHFLIERLMEWAVSRVAVDPGDGINGITAALCKGGDEGASRRAAPAA
jgi:hypothetical protein